MADGTEMRREWTREDVQRQRRAWADENGNPSADVPWRQTELSLCDAWLALDEENAALRQTADDAHGRRRAADEHASALSLSWPKAIEDERARTRAALERAIDRLCCGGQVEACGQDVLDYFDEEMQKPWPT